MAALDDGKKLYKGLSKSAQRYFLNLNNCYAHDPEVMRTVLQHPSSDFDKFSNAGKVMYNSIGDSKIFGKPLEQKSVNRFFKRPDVVDAAQHHDFCRQMNLYAFDSNDKSFQVTRAEKAFLRDMPDFYSTLTKQGKKYFDANMRQARYGVKKFEELKTKPKNELSKYGQRDRDYLDNVSQGVIPQKGDTYKQVAKPLTQGEKNKVDDFFTSDDFQSALGHHTLIYMMNLSKQHAQSTAELAAQVAAKKRRERSAAATQPYRYRQEVDKGLNLYNNLSQTGRRYLLGEVRTASYNLERFRKLQTASPSDLSPRDAAAQQHLQDIANGMVRSQNPDKHAIPAYRPMTKIEKVTVDNYLHNNIVQEASGNGDLYDQLYRENQRNRVLAEAHGNDSGSYDPYGRNSNIADNENVVTSASGRFAFNIGALSVFAMHGKFGKGLSVIHDRNKRAKLDSKDPKFLDKERESALLTDSSNRKHRDADFKQVVQNRKHPKASISRMTAEMAQQQQALHTPKPHISQQGPTLG